jgi:hypothetical protein
MKVIVLPAVITYAKRPIFHRQSHSEPNVDITVYLSDIVQWLLALIRVWRPEAFHDFLQILIGK